MKKRRILAAALSTALCLSNALPFAGSAMVPSQFADCTIDEISEKYSNEAVVLNTPASFGPKTIFVITEEDKNLCLCERYMGSKIGVEDGKILPIDEINAKIHEKYEEFEILGVYKDTKTEAYILANRLADFPISSMSEFIDNVVKSYDMVTSLTEMCSVGINKSWVIKGIYFEDTNRDAEEIIEEYKELNLIYDESKTEGNKKYFETFIDPDTSKDILPALRRMQVNEEKYVLDFMIAASAPEAISASYGEKVVYKKQYYLTGDTNCDGTVDISDAVLAKAWLLNSEKYSISEQGMINADVIGNDGINTQDAIAIQKYTLGLSEDFE